MKVEFYFDFTCPFAYIASTRIEALCAADSADLVWRPMLLGGVFRSIGAHDSPMSQMGPAKAYHNDLDMYRWAEVAGVPLHKPGAHPMRSVRALRALLSLPEARWPPIIHAMYRAYWEHGRDITSLQTIRTVLEQAGVAGPELDAALAANDDPAIKDALRRRTDQAVASGIFGAPTIMVHVSDRDRPFMFWGQDRLHMVRAVLRGWRPEVPSDRGLATPRPPRVRIDQLDPAPAPSGAEPGQADLHFWYDIASPFSYLAATQVAALAKRAGARLHWRPMLIGAVFKHHDISNVPLFAMTEPRRAYMYRDVYYWASYWDVPFRFASHFPQNTVTPLRLALLAGERIAELSLAMFRAVWVEDKNLEDPQSLASVLRDHDMDPDAMLARTKEPEVKQKLFDNTAEAVAAGVFGAPTCVITCGAKRGGGDLLFWGQDRLELVEAALRGWRPRA